MTEPPDVRIASDGIYIEGQKLPGLIIANGVTVKPGGTAGVTIMTVEFTVGAVYVEPLE